MKIGKVCAKHPELKGERSEKTGRCPQCVRENTDSWNLRNPGKAKDISARCVAASLPRLAEKEAHRYARKLQATPAWANDFFIQEAYALAKLREKICGGKWEVDHIVPLKSSLVCGLHTESNLRVIPRSQNRVKKNTYWPDMP